MLHFTHLRLALFALFVSMICAFASPTPNGTAVNLVKRVTHTGEGTWFHVGLGACGFTNVDSDPIVAIGIGRFGSGDNCNQWIKIQANGKTEYGLTRDACESCSTEDLDLSPSLFQKFAPLSQGVIDITWNFEAKGFTPP